MSIFSERLNQAMNIRNMKQNDLCYITGIPKSAMSQYVSGAFNPKQKRTYLIAKALNVSEAWLLGLNVPMEKVENVNFELSPHEKDVITAYRNQPPMQEAVDRLLGIPSEPAANLNQNLISDIVNTVNSIDRQIQKSQVMELK